MSTYLGSGKSIEIHSEEDLYGYFEKFAKPQECMRVGLEAEFFPVYRQTGKALPYEGKVGVLAILQTLSQHFGYAPIMEGSVIIALKKGDSFITLEPGGQIELSAPPVKTIFEVQGLLDAFLADLKRIEEYFPEAAFLAFGIQPFSRVDDISLVPKKRYRLMADYLGAKGVLAHHMMKLTATNQINFDYLSETHAMDSLRVVLGISPIVSALFANACFSEGKPNGFLSKRQEIWRHTDADRSGIPECFLAMNASFRDYVEYLLKMPVMFIVRDDKWYSLNGISFRDFVRHGFEQTRATLADFELHLSTAFPEARLKQYLEIRGIDGQQTSMIPAVAAFWKGILYSREAREKAWALVAEASRESRRKLFAEVPKTGLNAAYLGKPLWDYAEELVGLSCESLARQVTVDETRTECLFLQKIMRELLEPRLSPAEHFLKKWETVWEKKPSNVIEALRI